MVRHLFKMAWKRKGKHLFVGVEILFAFLLLVIVFTLGCYWLDNYRRPLGFAYQDAWAVMMFPEGGWRKWTEEDSVAMQQVYRILRDFEEVAAVAEESSPPFAESWSENVAVINGTSIDYFLSYAGDDLDQVLDLGLIAGRWFDRSDNAAPEEPVVINQRLAEALFKDEDPVGKRIVSDSGDQVSPLNVRVVGVVSEHRQSSPFQPPGYFLFHRSRLDQPLSSGHLPVRFLIRVRPGMLRSFERQIRERLQAVAPGWTADISPLAERRAQVIQKTVEEFQRDLRFVGLAMLMVALGLVGVLWQSVTQRTREIGIRRAAGATRGQVHLQFAGEVLALATVAVALGAVLIFHLAVFDLFPMVSTGVYIAGLLTAAAVLYGLVIAAALYPGWLAARVQPAQALHYE